ncbi:MAG: AAA family ATPase [Saprospiraceae bacterium]
MFSQKLFYFHSFVNSFCVFCTFCGSNNTIFTRLIFYKKAVYVDKTKMIHNIINTANLYFLSRPRRFGKSLLVATLKEIFQGNKEIFQDLWIGQQTDYTFESFPVLHFNFADYGHKVENIEEILNHEVSKYAQQFGIELNEKSLGNRFKALVKNIAKKGKPVVLLIDEYDKPMVDFITEVDKAKANRKVLRSFFSPLKGLDLEGHLKFLFITGISKFSKVSLFSDLNNLTDLSKSPLANDLLGITQKELEDNFQDYIKRMAENMNLPENELLKHIKQWYNGYSYDGKITLYNPFSLLNFFTHFQFDNYWFETGTPTFLVEIIQENYVNPRELEYIEVDNYFFNSFILEKIDVIGLLYQTGYLTIKEATYSVYGSSYVLGYPNIEVRQSMIYNLTQAYTYKSKTVVSSAMVKMRRGLHQGKMDIFIEQLKIILSDISYHLHPPSSRGRLKDRKKAKNEAELFIPSTREWEGYFQTVIYLVTAYLELTVSSEVTKHKGRLDLVAETENFIYLMEFKLDGTATNAIEQIKNREYAAAYKNASKQVVLVGVNFSKEERNVESFEVEVWEQKH